jgi:hypothetical protein
MMINKYRIPRLPRLKTPKLKFPKLDKKRKRFLIVSLIALAFFVSGGVLLSSEDTRPLFDYGTVDYDVITAGISTDLNAGDTVYADVSSARITFVWTSNYESPDARDFKAELKTSIWDVVLVEDSTKVGNTYTFSFDLKKCHEGTFSYYFELYCTTGTDDQWFYSGTSFSFIVVNTFETIDPPVFITPLPEDITEQPLGYYSTLKWDYKYGGPATLTLQQDGEVVDTQTIAGSPHNQQYVYIFDPGEEGAWRFRFTIDPDEILHLPIWDEMDVGFVSWEDYTLIDEIPEGLENVGVVMDGSLAAFGLDLHHQWLIGNLPPAGVHAYPKQGDLTIRLMFHLVGVSIDILGDTKVVMFNTAEERTEYPMTTVYEVGFGAFGLSFDSWKEVVISLDSIPAGEYRCEIRTVSPANMMIYKIATFNLSVNTFPIGFVATYGGIILAIGIVSIVSIKALREVRGWWSFKGKYVK